MKKIFKIIKPSSSPLKSFKVSNFLNEHMKKKFEATNRLSSQFAQNMRKSNEIIMKQAEEFKRRMVELKKLEPNITEAHKLLAEIGWYFDYRWTPADSLKIFDSLKKGDIEVINDWMIKYFRGNYEKIEIEIIDRFPQRKVPLSQAFMAHKRKEYYLSIPVFLAQSDGICKELAGIGFYNKKNKKHIIANRYKNKIESEFDKSMLIPILEKGAFRLSEGERSEDFHFINRHMILHGESSSYGTEINSLKSISMMNYLVHFLQYKEKQ